MRDYRVYLFSFGIPLRGNQSKAGRDSTLSNTKEEPDSQSSAITADTRHTAQDGAPGYNSASTKLAYRESLQQAIGRVLERQIPKVEHGGHPRVVISYKVNILLEAHDRGILMITLAQLKKRKEGDMLTEMVVLSR